MHESSVDPYQYDGTEGFVYLQRTLLGHSNHGVLASAFTSDIGVLQQLLSIHGIPSAGLSVFQCHSAYMYHLFSGDCSESRICHSNRTACAVLSVGFDSPFDMSKHAFNILATACVSDCSTDEFLYVFKCLNISTQFTPSNTRRQCVSLLKSLSRNFMPEQSLLPCSNFFSHFDRLTRPQLLSIAHMHRISVMRFTDTKFQLKNAVLEHFVSGKCLEHADCIQNPICLAGVNEMDPRPTTSRSFSLRWLQAHLQEIPSSALKKILAILSIEFEETDSLSHLRTLLRKYICSQTLGSLRVEPMLDSEQWEAVRDV